MSITLTSNWQEVHPELVGDIENLIDEGYDLDDILQFIDVYETENFDYCQEFLDIKAATDARNCEIDEFIEKYDFDDFINYYVQYYELSENYCEDAVDAYIECYGIDYLNSFEDSYEGSFNDHEEFIDNYLENYGSDIPSWIVIDYDATWEHSLRHDYSEQNGFYFRDN